jgi:hypothetical protein
MCAITVVLSLVIRVVVSVRLVIVYTVTSVHILAACVSEIIALVVMPQLCVRVVIGLRVQTVFLRVTRVLNQFVKDAKPFVHVVLPFIVKIAQGRVMCVVNLVVRIVGTYVGNVA